MPSSASRPLAVTTMPPVPFASSTAASPVPFASSRQWPLEVGDELLRVRPRNHRHQLPAVLAPIVEDLLGRVHQQRHGRVLPLLHARTVPGRTDRKSGPTARTLGRVTSP